MSQNSTSKQFKTVLAIETTCDETGAAVGQLTPNGVIILSNVVSSSADLQAKYGGVIPEQAARMQLEYIIPVVDEALSKAVNATDWKRGKPLYPSPYTLAPNFIDAVAVTYGPGLIGSLLVGVETAKTLSLIWNEPLIPVNHLIAHFYANWVMGSHIPNFPVLGLLVSGGHTDLVLFENHGKYKYLGGTRDDAAGECFDKCARLLGLPYPGGPNLSRAAETGNPKAFNLPRPMINSGDLDFSFSGLKTAVANLVGVERAQPAIGGTARCAPTDNISNLAAAIQEAIVDTLIKKVITAAHIHRVEEIMIAGGVSANKRLREKLTEAVEKEFPQTKLYIPEFKYSTDNAAMIACAALYNPQTINPLDLQANPGLSLVDN